MDSLDYVLQLKARKGDHLAYQAAVEFEKLVTALSDENGAAFDAGWKAGIHYAYESVPGKSWERKQTFRKYQGLRQCKHGAILYGNRCLNCEREPERHEPCKQSYRSFLSRQGPE